MKSAARALRDEINTYRESAKMKGNTVYGDGTSLTEYQMEFIRAALSNKALQFGEFTLKSGRISPYFFNAGMFASGKSLSQLARAYCAAIRDKFVEFDVFFGPAYKGIPLVTAISMAWYELYGESKDVAYNRKEAKDHGEGGILVGGALHNRRVLIVDDVITAGTAIRESVDMIERHSSGTATVVGVAVSLDRQETTAASSVNETSSAVEKAAQQSAIQKVEEELGVGVISIMRLSHLVQFVHGEQATIVDAENLARIKAYRASYGVIY